MIGFIYSIKSNYTNKVYIGSTCMPVAVRFQRHRSAFKRWLKGKADYISSFDILKFNDAYYEILAEVTTENKEDLLKKEGSYMMLNNCVNKHIAGRTQEQYYQDNVERKKKYYIDTREKKLAYQRNYNKGKILKEATAILSNLTKMEATPAAPTINGEIKDTLGLIVPELSTQVENVHIVVEEQAKEVAQTIDTDVKEDESLIKNDVDSDLKKLEESLKL